MNSRLLLVSGLLAASAQAKVPVSKLAAEWLVPHSTDPNAFTLVDTATGTVRPGAMKASGTVGWRNPVATGVTNVSAVCAAVPAAVGEAVAVTSLEANRVMIVETDITTPLARVMPNLAGMGPSGLAITVTGGASELMVLSSQNGSIAGRSETHANMPTTATLNANTATSLAYDSLQPLINPSAPATILGFYSAPSVSGTATGVLARSGSSINRYSQTSHPGSFRFTPAVRSVDGASSIPLILGIRPGTSQAAIIKVNNPTLAGTFTSTSVSFPHAMVAVVPLLNGGYGPLADGFIAIAADGTRADWIRINAAGTALVSTTQSFTPAAGLSFTGMIPLPGVGMIHLEGASAAGPSTSFKSFLWNGSSWIQADSGSLPGIAATALTPASLLFFNADPSADESAALIGIQAVADWTRPLSYPAPFPATVRRETFGSAAGGLAITANHTVSAPPGASFLMTNQPEAGVSVTALGGAGDLLEPALQIEPPSGPCSGSIQVTALYDEQRQELFWRDANGGSWTPWTGPLAVSYTRQLQFSLQSIATGVMGPIESRSYTFGASNLTNADADGDGVPDYVEQHYGLDAFGGPDHDGDGWSDLDELLNGTNPASSASSPLPGTSKNIVTGGGFRIAVTARNHAATEIANGEEISAHAIDGSLLDREAVASFSSPLPDGGTRGALLTSDTAVPADQLVALATPLYFNIMTSARSGRELRGFIKSPTPVAFSPTFTPAGSNLATDATGWVTAAQAAAAAMPIAAARIAIDPADTAVAVLMEDLAHRAITAARPPSDPAPALDAFTFFPDRASDRTRTPLAVGDADMLRAGGFDLRLALDLANAARASMTNAANQLYSRHAATSASTPGMAMPLDALRIMLRGGGAPAGYSGAVGSINLNNARNAYNQAIASFSSSYRPKQTWTVEVMATPPTLGAYWRISESSPVILLDRNGGRIRLEQGLGLRPGTRFTVTGFTDTPEQAGMDSMEVNLAVFTFAPSSSDNDSDGNLLDDEWERFFFGSTGQDPFSDPHGNGYQLLQYFLDGVDPRSGESPAGPPVSLGLQAPVLRPTTIPGAAFFLDFLFPSAYQNSFEFILEASSSLQPGSFTAVSGASITATGGDELRATIPSSAATASSTFYRIALRLRQD
jgi:hypothetical protein